LWTFISEQNSTFTASEAALVWKEEGLNYGSWDSSTTRKKSIEITPSEVNCLQKGVLTGRNSKITAVSTRTHTGCDQDTHRLRILQNTIPQFSTTSIVRSLSLVHTYLTELNRYIKKAPIKKTHNLISGEIDEEYLKRKKWVGEYLNPALLLILRWK
jgi:hypothetical protein